ncbi:MAG: citrate synthase family protein [Gammaproteobacteria bacterium]
MKTENPAWVSATEAVEMLGVSRATLYAYVSRGRIRSEATVGKARNRRYARDDIERLRARTDERRNPEKAAEHALHWGLPILESAITLIAEGHIYYRGRDAAELAGTASLADVAALLWTGSADGGAQLATTAKLAGTKGRDADAPFVARAQATLALAAAKDPLGYDLRPRAVAQTGWRILQALATVAANGSAREPTIDATLAKAWGVPAAAPLLRAALILCADHELNVSTFTARCVASAGGSPYGVVIAGLAALEGVKHGGTTGRIEALWDSLRRTSDLRAALAERLRRGDRIDGFGHPLYAGGDPRASVLLALLPKSKNAEFARALTAAVNAVLGEPPNVDFTLVALAKALGLPNGTALTLFALGRTMGWIGHAIEQYAHDAIIRPRAKYVGEKPL